MTLRQAKKFLEGNLPRLRAAFSAARQAPTGGLLNPRVVSVQCGELEIRCHYDNYDTDEDSWTWFLDPETLKFHN